ncbi:LPD38 domain-containing protein [Flavobacterium sp. HSC-61S13]|uniref:putative polyvalent protein kinase domain-containing protein n=1 Tax=Flavobacterium sp. HSC-61S13 TaxID=2910963 RepID=UPI00209FCE9C|nr:LPD38 domain-containing protein [Flavobacterium sp. HSC-61S13]MCP1996646.1 hypothetical protein [Flavobacterium sp. HSC-61S13]
MDDKKYTYKGQEYSHEALRAKYGDKTQEAITKFGFKEILSTTEPQFIFKGQTYSREDLESKYGDKVDEAIQKFGIKPLKKKDATQSTSQSQKSAFPLERSSSATSLNPIEKITKTITENSVPESSTPTSQGAVEGTMAWNNEKLKKYNPEYSRLFDQFQQSKTISDDKKQEIVQGVDAEINQSGFVNNLKTYGKKGFNLLIDAAAGVLPVSEREKVVDKFKMDTNPLSDELKEVDGLIKKQQIQAKKENKPLPIVTDEERIAQARALKINKNLKSQEDTQTRALLKDLQNTQSEIGGPTHKDKLNTFQTFNYNSLKEKDKFNLEKQNLLRGEIENIQARVNEVVEESKNTPIGPEKQQEFSELQNRYNSILKEAISTHQDYVSNTKELGQASENIDVFKRDYSWFKNFTNNAGATGLDLTAGLIGATDWIGETTGTGSPVQSRILQEAIKGVSKDVRAGIAKPISVDEINDISDFGQWFWNTAVASQIPIYAMVATGAGGTGALGVSATGTKYDEMRSEEDTQGANYSYLEKALVPLGFGATETASAMVDRMLLTNASRVIKSATSPERAMIAKGFWKSAVGATGEVVKGGVYEGLDESATEIMQNVMDKFVLGKDVGIFDNVKDAASAGAIMGLLIPSASHIVSSAIKPFSLDNRIQKANAQILEFEKTLDQNSTAPSVRIIVEDQISTAKTKLNGLLVKQAKGIEDMPQGEFDEIRRIERTQANIKQKVREIQNEENLSDDIKKQLANNLKEEFDTAESQRRGLLNGEANAKLNLLRPEEVIKLKDQASRELIAEKDPEGTKEVDLKDEEISARALKIYQKQNSERDIIVPLNNPIENEIPQAENTIINEDVRTGAINVEEVSNTLENQEGESVIREEVQETGNTQSIREPKVKEIKASTNGKPYSVSYENNELVFKDENGGTPSRPTIRILQKEYAKSLDFTEGQESDTSNIEEGVTANKHIAETSQNASQIAEAIALTSREEYRSELDYKQRMIAENIGAVSRESFVDNADVNYITQSIAMQYFGKKGEGRPLDSLAQEISEISGVEVTEQDIVDFIVENPRGKKDFLDRNMKEDLTALKTAFTEITGLPATDHFLNQAFEQKATKQKFYDEYASLFDVMNEEDFVNLQTENDQYYEQERRNSTQTNDASRTIVSEVANTTENGERSRVQEESRRDNSESTSKERGGETGILDGGPQSELGSSNEESSRKSISDNIRGRIEEAKREFAKNQPEGESLEMNPHDLSDLEKRVVFEYAKENNLWIDDIYSLGKAFGSGNENTVVLNAEERSVYKSNNLFNSQFLVSNLLDYIENHNKLFPETSYELVGFSGFDNGANRAPYVEVVIKQPFVSQAEHVEKSVIASFMESLGFTKVTDTSFTNGQYTVSDLHPRNVLKSEEGIIYVIDNMISENKEHQSSTKDTKVNLSHDLKINDFIEGIDKLISDIDKFGKDTLGMNLPLVVARQGLMAMKLAAQTASTVADIISAGLNAVQQTEWYKNLTSVEKSDLDNNFIDYLNKPYERNASEKSRTSLEKEVDEHLKNGVSEKDILKQYSDRMEKMMAKDYLERQKAVTEEDAKKIVDDSFDKADKEADALMNPKFSLDKAFSTFIAKFFDRQFLPKFILNKSGGRLVRNYIVASKGATAFAKQMYDEAHSKIYKGLSSPEIKLLDRVIQLKRFIAIDENRRKENLPTVVHQDYINDNVAKAYLSTLETELGSEKFNDLVKRSEAYFDTFRDLLDQMLETGIISKESRDRFFDIDYQPRQFLEFMQNAETETAHLDNGNTGGLGQEQIQKLERGLDTSLVNDSQYLLSRAINMRAKTIALNRTNSKLVEFMEKQATEVAQLKSKINPTKKERDTIKYFEELQKRVKHNPIIGFTESGNPIYKTKKTPIGFSNTYYYVNGVKNNILMEDQFHEQYFDSMARIFKTPDIKEKVAMSSGVGLVKAIATGNNPTFFITNTPRDFLFISTFSEEYGANLLKNFVQLTGDASQGIRDIRKETDNFKNFIKYGGMMDFLMEQGRFKGTSSMQKVLDKIDNKTKERTKKAFSVATLQSLQMYSEVGFRMAVFNRSIKNQLKELGLKKIEEVTEKNQLEDIYTNAVSSARNTMDFNQGGAITKDIDAFIPYLNAATQGTRVMFDNFRERPIETTLRVTQAAAIMSSVPIGVSLALLSGTGSEDEKDMTSSELYNKAIKGVSKYDRINYFIVFNGNRNDKGEFQYFRIAKAQQLTPFFSLTENIMRDYMKASAGDKSRSNTIRDIGFALEKNISPVEFGITDNVTRNPLIKGALSYATGYDFFREQDLSILRGKVPVPAEGFENASVEDFYKKIGEQQGWSPVRMKAAVESIVTTPSTSPYIGMLYGGMDAMMSDKDSKAIMDKFKNDMLKSSFNRAVKETSEFNRRIGQNEEIKKELEKIEIENLKFKNEVKAVVKDHLDGNITRTEVNKKLNEITTDMSAYDKKRARTRVSDQIKNKNVNSAVFEIKYANNAQHKALLMVELFGSDLNNSEKLSKEDLKLKRQMFQYKAINAEAMFEYRQLINETKKAPK